MILPSNQHVVHQDDVEGVKEEFRQQAAGARPSAAVDQVSWDMVDQASWESFPASDSPPWTLGYIGPPAAG